MHPDIEKMINIAKERGELTEKQKEIILRKTEKLGEDVDEVELVLESLPAVSQRTASEKKKRKTCPNCGATILATSLECPECQYVFRMTDALDEHAYSPVATLAARLQAIDNSLIYGKDEKNEKKASMISSFSLPPTKEELLQFLEFAFSNTGSSLTYATNESESKLFDAWNSKSLMACDMLERLGGTDSSFASEIRRYRDSIHLNVQKNVNRQERFIKNNERKTVRYWLKKGAIIYLGMIVFSLIISIPILIEDQKDSKIIEKVESCIQQNDFYGARAAAAALKNQSDRDEKMDEINTAEIRFLISERKSDEAKIILSSINNETRKAELKEIIDLYDSESNE